MRALHFHLLHSSAHTTLRSLCGAESIDWIRSRQTLRDHYTNDERGLYNEPQVNTLSMLVTLSLSPSPSLNGCLQDMVDLYEMAKVIWSRFKYGMKAHVYSGYSLGGAPSKRRCVHHLKVGHQVWIKMDSADSAEGASLSHTHTHTHTHTHRPLV